MATLNDRLEIERRLTAQLIRLNNRIEKLQTEKKSLEALIIAHRAGHLPQKGALRKNSISKSTIQMQILDIVRSARRPISTFDIFQKLKEENSDLNDSTFRSYIFRLKAEGAIEVRGRRGYYTMTRTEPDPSHPQKIRKIVIRKPGAVNRADK